MIKLSAVIITYNEESNIKRCIESIIDIVDEIVIVDSFSRDRTKEICMEFDLNFIEKEFLGYIQQKNYALKRAKYDYILSLDGDEVLSSQLQNSIKALKNNWVYDGYYCNRLNNFCGQWIKYSDWYPNKKLRVFDKRKAKWCGINPHDKIKLNNPRKKTGQLKGDILHWTYKTYNEMDKKTDYFSSIAAKSYKEKKISAPKWKIFLNPAWAFFKAYFIRLGILDGKNGFLICYQTWKITYLKYTKLRALWKTKD